MKKGQTFVTLADGYKVIRATERAVCIKKGDDGPDVWLPRSGIQDGDALDEHDTDLAVANWLVDKEELEIE